MNDADTRERLRKEMAVGRAMVILREEGFDSIMLLVTYMDEHGNTCARRASHGNWYASTELMRAEVRHRERPDADEDED